VLGELETVLGVLLETSATARQHRISGGGVVVKSGEILNFPWDVPVFIRFSRHSRQEPMNEWPAERAAFSGTSPEGTPLLSLWNGRIRRECGALANIRPMASGRPPRHPRRRGPGSCALLFISLLSVACDFVGDGLRFPPLTIPSVPCTEDTDLFVVGFLPADAENFEFKLSVGESRRLLLTAGLGVDCRAFIRSVEWITEDPKVAVFEATGIPYAWLTARDAGSTRFGANVTFLSGKVRRVVPDRSSQGSDVLRVSPRTPRGGRQVLLSGELDIPPTTVTSPAHAYVPLDLTLRGTVDMIVDWTSVANGVSANLCQGSVAPGFGCSPTAIPGRPQADRKPIENSAILPAGTYTLWIASNGPGAERVRYEIGIIPE
jgi:hypothetical protein